MTTILEGPVLIQGNQYSFHAQAATALGISLERCIPMDTHAVLYKLLRADDAQSAVVAVANSAIGRITGSYEELLVGDLTVIDRVDLPINFGLYAWPGTTEAGVHIVHTQSHAYKQCMRKLAHYVPAAQWQEEQDTAGSALIVEKLGRQGNTSHAAICPKSAGEAAGLVCLRDTMQDNEKNFTTFYWLTRAQATTEQEDSTTLVVILNIHIPIDYRQLQEQLISKAGITMRPLDEREQATQPLIVEIPTTNPAETIRRMEHTVKSQASIKCIGSYTKRPISHARTKSNLRYAIMEYKNE